MFSTRTHISLLTAVACASAIAVVAIGSSTASAAPTSPRATQTWSYEAYVVNNTTHTLKLIGAVPASGSAFAASPPATLAPGQSGEFELTSTLLDAGGTVTYSDPSTNGQVSIQGQANSARNDSYSFAVGMNRLGASGPWGYFSGVNPNVSVSYSITN